MRRGAGVAVLVMVGCGGGGGGGDAGLDLAASLDGNGTDTADAAAAADTATPDGATLPSTRVPALGFVAVIVMENHRLADLRGNPAAPYLNRLLDENAQASHYVAVANPSLPNYLALASGSTAGVTCDCLPTGAPACSAPACTTSCACGQTGAHLGDQLDAAGMRWRVYAEGMGAPCATASNPATHFKIAHVPFVYFADVRDDPVRCAEHLRDLADLAGDLAAGAAAPRFVFIVPNLCHSMHDNCGADPVAVGDGWLAATVPAITATAPYSFGGALFIVFDENGASVDSLPFVLLSPKALPHATSSALYDHYSLLATIEDALGLPRLGAAQGARAIDDLWLR